MPKLANIQQNMHLISGFSSLLKWFSSNLVNCVPKTLTAFFTKKKFNARLISNLNFPETNISTCTKSSHGRKKATLKWKRETPCLCILAAHDPIVPTNAMQKVFHECICLHDRAFCMHRESSMQLPSLAH